LQQARPKNLNASVLTTISHEKVITKDGPFHILKDSLKTTTVSYDSNYNLFLAWVSFFPSQTFKQKELACRISLKLNTQDFKDYLIDLTDIRYKNNKAEYPEED